MSSSSQTNVPGPVPSSRFWRDLEELLNIKVISVTRRGFSGLARGSEVVRGVDWERVELDSVKGEFEVGEVVVGL